MQREKYRYSLRCRSRNLSPGLVEIRHPNTLERAGPDPVRSIHTQRLTKVEATDVATSIKHDAVVSTPLGVSRGVELTYAL